ncbi:DUF427 domain-containing protein [Sphingomicrobium astaxanthinifaciens]|nr:DUF427 domain-containing protein [Sphingomicrobium astaxanthinifaciens]MCJ7421615.1 DUF427 domain-containing protein [Sphingomicrobium astaxanthinifaciens]
MVKASWNGETIAQSDDTVEVEGNHYFPREHVKMDRLVPSDTRSHCPWKGEARYFSIKADGVTNADAAWSYEEPKEAASQIKRRIAFWKGVEVG